MFTAPPDAFSRFARMREGTNNDTGQKMVCSILETTIVLFTIENSCQHQFKNERVLLFAHEGPIKLKKPYFEKKVGKKFS